MAGLTAQLQARAGIDVTGAPEGHDLLLAAEAARAGRDVVFVARDDVGMSRRAALAAFFAPDLRVLGFPAWDCLPYDRVSPRPALVSERVDTLCRLAAGGAAGRLILTTVSALLQRVPPPETFADALRSLEPGLGTSPAALAADLETRGYMRVGTVVEPGEYAVRGGIVDVFPAGRASPLRLDFFGDELDTLRTFDAATQRGGNKLSSAELGPVSELALDAASIERFRSGYRTLFGVAGDDDPLYEAVSAGHRHMGMEHWLPLFHDQLGTLFDYLDDAALFLDHRCEEARDARLELIAEYYTARQDFLGREKSAADVDSGLTYRPVPPERLYLDAAEWEASLAARSHARLLPFGAVEDATGHDAGGRPAHDFAPFRVDPNANVYEGVRDHVATLHGAGKRVVTASLSDGSRDRLAAVLAEHGLEATTNVADAAELDDLAPGIVAMAVLEIDHGFEAPNLAVISEADILGDRMGRPRGRRTRPENVIAEAASLSAGDLVVHLDHGVARFDGLETIEVGGAPHDCLKLVYSGDDKLFLPVENIDMVSRYGSEEAGAQLDRLGGAAWQARKAKMKSRIRDMAEALIGVAASRELHRVPEVTAPEGIFDEFCARFPFSETDDQRHAIDDAMADLANGRPTDRLVCGDVGFGKTEVALRAAFAVAMQGRQVAVVVPTTLLCRQHFLTFQERFRGFPVRIAQLSRLVTARDSKATKEELKSGKVDIVIGTHALLAKDVGFADLGLLVVDEEQHFGVSHKERLKSLKADVHVLTLTATPIPRTLQMALTGIREMSLIATPPVDRLAVRTFVLPFDPVIVREAILREQLRGGQTFYVCPRVNDLDRLAARLADLVPEVKIGMAHGRLPVRELEETIARFYDGGFDVLLSTNIIESGLDLPSVNTIIVHRSDMFGLAQLYQLRGRVGRSKVRAYAYLTLPPGQKLTAAAEKRLEVMQTLDTLGAGFTLASHDLDIRGAGNLLGEEQSGHIREVGIELYQHMLEEAVAEARGIAGAASDDWSPQLSLGMAVLIPDYYVPDLGVRMGLYRRLAWLADRDAVDAFGAELIDRFGPLPEAAENLLTTVALKLVCKAGGVARIEAGPKGAVVSFKDDHFANPAGLVDWITAHRGTAKLRPDHRLVLMRSWEDIPDRLEGVRYLASELARITKAAEAGQAAE